MPIELLQRDAMQQRRRTEQELTPEADVQVQGVYIISVACRILGMHPQTLRKYERMGLIRPSRTAGHLRLYSDKDIARLRMIKHLVDELRLNLAGVEMVMALVERLDTLRQRVSPDTGIGDVFEAFEREVQDILQMLQGLDQLSTEEAEES
ncbi:MAG: MerR family transcriptional regulator [SAR202 cluster bacterium]|nr:MerR family transcriptional regulator [SAR202 cluster bacterium]